MISFGDFENITTREAQIVDSVLTDVLSNSVYWAERSAAEWLLKHSGRNLKPEVISVQRQVLSGTSVRPGIDPDFWTNSQGQTMVVIRGPVSFDCGSPTHEHGREVDENIEHHTIAYSYAVSACEVTVEQLRRFRKDAEVSWPDIPADTAAHKVAFTEALQYCRWLSDEEMIPENQMCYPAVPDITDQIVLPQETLLRNGYRLLTEPEWEYACRAGSVTPWFFGSNESHAEQFAWSLLNSMDHVRSVGFLRPNEFGLFDMSGNVAEWCHSSRGDLGHPLRGGAFRMAGIQLRSARRYFQSATGYSFTGFRIARTLTTSSADISPDLK